MHYPKNIHKHEYKTYHQNVRLLIKQIAHFGSTAVQENLESYRVGPH